MKHTHEHDKAERATILIVEDHESVRRGLHDWLSIGFPNCRILGAESGEEAVALVHAHSPDIVLMDIGLPQMNGIEATRRIKAAVPKVKVVMVSMHDTPTYRADAGAAGANGYVPKGEMASKLVPRVAKLLAQPRGKTPLD